MVSKPGTSLIRFMTTTRIMIDANHGKILLACFPADDSVRLYRTSIPGFHCAGYSTRNQAAALQRPTHGPGDAQDNQIHQQGRDQGIK